MKTSSKIAIAAAAVGAWLIAKKKQSVSGYRRSYDNGKSYGRAFFDALARRADKINAEMAEYDR